MNLKVSQLGHSKANMEEREQDGTVDQHKAQVAAFNRDILKGKDAADVNPLDPHQINWRPDSVFTVEKRVSDGDVRNAPYSVLNGRNRLDWLLGCAAKNPAFHDFEITCEVVEPRSEAERRAYIAKGNADAPDNATVIKPSNVKRFAAWYPLAPKPDYLFTKDPTGALRPVEHSAVGWTSLEYQNETGIGGSLHVPFSALTRLGRHFGIDVSVFNAARLRIKPQLSVAYLVKKTAAGNDNKVTKHLPEGIEPRYIAARANADSQVKLDEVEALFKAEFLAMLDATDAASTGEKALGNEPEKTVAEKKADEVKSVAQMKEEQERGQRLLASKQIYAFERDTLARFFKLPEAQDIAPTIGNALDVLSKISPVKLESATVALATWKESPTSATGNEAIKALASALMAMLPSNDMPKVALKATKHKAK